MDFDNYCDEDWIDDIRPSCCPHHPDAYLEQESSTEWFCPEEGCEFIWTLPEDDGITDRERL